MPITKASSSAVAPGAKGELVVGSATNDSAILAVGANDTVLTADSSTATGVKWAAAGGGAENYTLINTGGTALTGATSITVSGISGKNSLFIVIQETSSTAGLSNYEMRFNSDSTLKYNYVGWYSNDSLTVTPDYGFGSNNSLDWGTLGSSSTNIISAMFTLNGANSSGLKSGELISAPTGSGNYRLRHRLFTYSGTSTISSVTVISGTGNFDSGTIYVYGA
jgi:hypothetical protein